MSKALEDILIERKNQDEQWGGPEHDDTHSQSDWMRFIFKQYEHWQYGRSAREVLVKIAALALAAVESIDRKG